MKIKCLINSEEYDLVKDSIYLVEKEYNHGEVSVRCNGMEVVLSEDEYEIVEE